MRRLNEIRSIASLLSEIVKQEEKDNKKNKNGNTDDNDVSSLKKDGKDKAGFPDNLKRTITGKKPEKLVIYEKKDTGKQQQQQQ